eukprot:357660-Chlamydomonas_euryale.AAC.5
MHARGAVHGRVQQRAHCLWQQRLRQVVVADGVGASWVGPPSHTIGRAAQQRGRKSIRGQQAVDGDAKS